MVLVVVFPGADEDLDTYDQLQAGGDGLYGHAIATGAFLLSAATNVALEIIKLRLTPSAYPQAADHGQDVVLSVKPPSPPAGSTRWCRPMALDRALEAAREFAGLNQQPHVATTLRNGTDAAARRRRN